MKGLKIHPEGDKTRHERNKLGREGPMQRTEKTEDSENFHLENRYINGCKNIISLEITAH